MKSGEFQPSVAYKSVAYKKKRLVQHGSLILLLIKMIGLLRKSESLYRFLTSAALLPEHLDISLTLTVHFSNFDSLISFNRIAKSKGSGCHTEEFRCHDGSNCVHKLSLCDGKADCGDASDEGWLCPTRPMASPELPKHIPGM